MGRGGCRLFINANSELGMSHYLGPPESVGSVRACHWGVQCGRHVWLSTRNPHQGNTLIFLQLDADLAVRPSGEFLTFIQDTADCSQGCSKGFISCTYLYVYWPVTSLKPTVIGVWERKGREKMCWVSCCRDHRKLRKGCALVSPCGQN